MNAAEFKQQQDRIAEYQRLREYRDEVQKCLDAITEPDSDGPCGQNPFTGNTRESRRVTRIAFDFSPTRGGAPEVSRSLNYPHIEAHALGIALADMLRAKLSEVDAKITKL
jgi:hypothetical protein